MLPLSRRAVLAAGATLPFLGRPALAAAGTGTLRFGLSTYPPNIQPWLQTGTASITVKLMLFRGLTGYDTAGKLRPELAESWASDGPTAWVFKLRDAVFQNGQPVTADDVKWTLEQIAADGSTAYLAADFRGVERIETPDPRTVRIVTKQPLVTLPLLLASPHAPILARGSNAGGALGVGAGPFTIKSQERGVAIELAAFDKFYKPGLPKLAGIRFVAYADETLRVAALQAGDVDIIEYVPWQSMQAIEADPRLTLDSRDGPFMALGFNGDSGPFKDARVRRAVGHAIRREDIIQAAFFGRGSPLEGMPLLPDSEFLDARYAHGWKYDADRAKALLAEAGLGKGFSCTLLSTAQYGMHKSTAEVVQQHLAEIGVDVKLALPDWATRVNLGNKGQYEFCVQGTAAEMNDPDGLAPLVDGELPPSMSRSYGLHTPKLHELFVAGRGEFDVAKRKAIYAEVQRQGIEEAPLVGLAWRSQGYAMTKAVKGFRGLPGGLNFYSGYALDEVALG